VFAAVGRASVCTGAAGAAVFLTGAAAGTSPGAPCAVRALLDVVPEPDLDTVPVQAASPAINTIDSSLIMVLDAACFEWPGKNGMCRPSYMTAGLVHTLKLVFEGCFWCVTPNLAMTLSKSCHETKSYRASFR